MIALVDPFAISSRAAAADPSLVDAGYRVRPDWRHRRLRHQDSDPHREEQR